MLRTHTCGELNAGNIGITATITGWVNSRRDHGELIFIDLRDAYGITQVVFDPKDNRKLHEDAHSLKSEYVIKVTGNVRSRPVATENKKLATGAIELAASELEILNTSVTPPFEVMDSHKVSEDTRLKYRSIDLRNPAMQQNLRLRYKMTKILRDYLDQHKFVDVEMPILTRSTPEGARDYLVPSRVNEGCFFALPQSPQLFKQILMVSGLDRYYQIARCFRDEDLRADRQPEFTQLDIEMSFIDQDDIFAIVEGLVQRLFREIRNEDVKIPFPRMPYSETMRRFGSDKPDMRVPIEFSDITDLVAGCGFNVFKTVAAAGGKIMGFAAPGCADLTVSKIGDLTKLMQSQGAKGLAHFKVEEASVQSQIAKFLLKKNFLISGDVYRPNPEI